MTLLEWSRNLDEAEKTTPGVRQVNKDLKVILSRILILQRAMDNFNAGATDLVEFPFSELAATVSLIEALILTAEANLEIPFDLIVTLRSAAGALRKLRVLKDLFDSRSRRKEVLVNAFDTTPRARKAYQVIQGDTLRGIAHRFLKDQSRWSELVSLNNLDFPYVITEPGITIPAGKNIVKAGDLLTLPLDAQNPGNDVVPKAPTDLTSVLGTDIFLSFAGDLSLDSGGDFKTASGPLNLEQGLRNRLVTDKGELPLHPTYGSDLKRSIGMEADELRVGIAGMEAWKSVLEDPRITRVANMKTIFESSELRVTFNAFVIGQESPVPQNLVLPL